MRSAQKVAIVTGGAQGMGKAIALALAREGLAVSVADISFPGAETTAAAIVSQSGRAIAVHVDVSQSRSVSRMIDDTLAKFGRLDVLVNNAGIIGHMSILDLTEAEWDRVLAVNLKGTFLCCQFAARAMAVSNGGAIINISSLSAEIPEPECAHYGISKAGVLHLTKSFALALAKHNIRVVAVAPGTIRTPMNDDLLHTTFEEERLKAIPLGRIGTPEEVADTVAFLASGGARYITGSTIYVDGGQMLLR
jgi:NAD(P)-dependent dehydrogenase (short-subunit alcohol dehydrogenase family)